MGVRTCLVQISYSFINKYFAIIWFFYNNYYNKKKKKKNYTVIYLYILVYIRFRIIQCNIRQNLL